MQHLQVLAYPSGRHTDGAFKNLISVGLTGIAITVTKIQYGKTDTAPQTGPRTPRIERRQRRAEPLPGAVDVTQGEKCETKGTVVMPRSVRDLPRPIRATHSIVLGEGIFGERHMPQP